MNIYLCCTRCKQCSGIGNADADSKTTGPNDTPNMLNKMFENIFNLIVSIVHRDLSFYIHPTSSHGSVSESLLSLPDE